MSASDIPRGYEQIPVGDIVPIGSYAMIAQMWRPSTDIGSIQGHRIRRVRPIIEEALPVGYELIKAGEIVLEGSIVLLRNNWCRSSEFGHLHDNSHPKMARMSRKDDEMNPQDIKRLVDECAELARPNVLFQYKVNGRGVPGITNGEYLIGCVRPEAFNLVIAHDPELVGKLELILSTAVVDVQNVFNAAVDAAMAAKSQAIANHFAPKAEAVIAKCTCPLLEAVRGVAAAQ